MRIITILTLFITLTTNILAEDSPASEILYLISHNEVSDKKLIINNTVSIQINNQGGNSDAEITIPYSKGDKLSIGSAWIEDASGTIIRKLNNKDISDRSAISEASLYEDDFVKEFSLIHNQYPYKVIYSYQLTINNYFQIASYDFNTKKIKLKNATITVETPNDKPIKYNQKNINPPSITPGQKTTLYTWSFDYSPLPREQYATINNTNAPILKVAPLDFKYGVDGNFENWQTFGNWIYKLNANRDRLPLSETLKIDELLKGIDNDKDKAKKLYHYLQDYNRYINVKLNVGGLQTQTAEYVVTNRYGDCKALSNYMKAILKHAGIESFSTLINLDYKVEDIDSSFAFQDFNHVILTIPFDNDTTYLECTSNVLPFGYIHSSIQNRKALIVKENNSKLISIPAQNLNDIKCMRSITTTLNNDLSGTAHITNNIRGEKFEDAIYIAKNINKTTADKYIRNNVLTGSIDLLDFNFSRTDRDSSKVELKAQCLAYNIYKKFGNNISINPYSLKIPFFENPEIRKQNIQIDYPIYEEDNLVYEIPQETINKIPSDIEVKSKYGHYILKFGFNENKLSVYKSILIQSGNYSLDEYKEFYNFIQLIRNTEIKKYFIEII